MTAGSWALAAALFVLVSFTVLSLIPFVLSCILISFFRFIAHKVDILDKPNGSLKNHEQPTAYLGGVALFVAAVLSYWVLFRGVLRDFEPQGFNIMYITGLTILVIVGLIDDIFAISPLKKLLGQVVACIFFIQAGLFFHQSTLTFFSPSVFCIPEAFLTVLGIFLSVWWMLSIINAMNLLDIMDGLATTIAVIALLGMGSSLGGIKGSLILLPFVSILVGFFLFNKPKASIYLGDAGSLFIGGVLATVPFLFGWGAVKTWGGLFAPFIILLVPSAELCSLIIIRAHLGIPFYHGSPHHFALYMKRWGYSVKQILLMTGLLATFCSLMAYFVAFGAIHFSGALIISVVGAAFLFFLGNLKI